MSTVDSADGTCEVFWDVRNSKRRQGPLAGHIAWFTAISDSSSTSDVITHASIQLLRATGCQSTTSPSVGTSQTDPPFQPRPSWSLIAIPFFASLTLINSIDSEVTISCELNRHTISHTPHATQLENQLTIVG